MLLLTENIALIMNFIFGSSGLLFWFLNYKERGTKNKTDEANATIEMQKSYAQFVSDTNALINGIKSELSEVKNELKNYKSQCKMCTNNKLN